MNKPNLEVINAQKVIPISKNGIWKELVGCKEPFIFSDEVVSPQSLLFCLL